MADAAGVEGGEPSWRVRGAGGNGERALASAALAAAPAEGSSDPGSSSHGRRKELREMPSGGSCFVPAATQAEKCR